MSRAHVPSSPVAELAERRRRAAVGEGLLDAELAAFCTGGVSVILGARGLDGRPLAGLALACVRAGEGRLRLLVREAANADLIAALRAGGGLAATFTEPTNHRSIQLKSSGAVVGTPGPDDLAALAAQTAVFRRTLELIDYSPAFAAGYCRYRDGEIAAIEFAPEQGFVQTPGPGAGSAL